jgi:hypothetical protein
MYRNRQVGQFLFSGLLLAAFAVSSNAVAQDTHRFNFGGGGGGAGFSMPVQEAGSDLNAGWNFDVRGGFNAGHHLDADLDFNYNHFGLNSAALARAGEPGGSVGVWALEFQPAWHVLRRQSRANIYATGGFGLFHSNLSLTRPAVVTSYFCDPFWGCYPVSYGADQVVGSFSTVKPGFNVGAGIEFGVGGGRARVFAEPRYQRMFTNHGADISYLPVTFGVRW